MGACRRFAAPRPRAGSCALPDGLPSRWWTFWCHAPSLQLQRLFRLDRSGPAGVGREQHGSPVDRAERGAGSPRPLNLIRVIPAKGACCAGPSSLHRKLQGPRRPCPHACPYLASARGWGALRTGPRQRLHGPRSATRSPRQVVGLCHGAGATCIINDRVDIALAVGADGAHVGPEDLTVGAARRLLGDGPVLGASARTAADARKAVAAGASYLGVGPCYPTSTKDGLPNRSAPRGLRPLPRPWLCPSLRSAASRPDASLSCSRRAPTA